MAARHRPPKAVSVKYDANQGSTSYRRSMPLVKRCLWLSLAAVGTVVLVAWYVQRSRRGLEEMRSQVSRLIQRSQFDEAALLLKRLHAADPEDKDLRFQVAVVEHQRGNHELSRELAQELIDSQYPNAAVWMLENEYGDSFADWDEERKKKFHELIRLASNSPQATVIVRAQRMLGAYYLHQGLLPEALETFANLLVIDPAASLNAALVAQQLHEVASVRKFALEAKSHYIKHLDRNPRESIGRLQLSRALLLLNEEREALAVLSDGYGLTRQACFQQAAGEVLAVWAKRLKSGEEPSETLLYRLHLLHRASQCAPNDAIVLSSLLEILAEFKINLETYKPRLRDAFAQGSDSESLHFMLGMLGVLDGDRELAKLHLNLAAKSGSQLPTLLNNLALATLNDHHLTLDDGLRMADEALLRQANQPHFRETRGRLLTRLERWQEAIDELEPINDPQVKTLTYENLATAYRALGDDASAQRWQELVKSDAPQHSDPIAN